MDKTLFTINQHIISLETILFHIVIPIIVIILAEITIFFIIKLFLQSMDNIRIEKTTHKNKHNTYTSSEKPDVQENISTEDIKKIYTPEMHKKLKKYLEICITLSSFIVILVFISELFIINLFKIFTKPFYTIGTTKISLMTTLLILLLGYLSYLLSNFIRRMSKKILSRLPAPISRRYSPIIQIIGYATLFLSFMIGLSLLGINLSSFTVLFGVLGVGLGFGLQDIVSNFFSGLVISFSGIMKEGDRVFIHDIEGDVVRINLINTVIRSLFYEELIVPNKIILNQPIQNYSHSDNFVIISTSVSVDYSSDMHLVERVLIECAKKLPNRIPHEEIYYRLSSFGDSGIEVKICVWIYDVKDKYASISKLNTLIWEAFKEHNINIPFPQVEMRMKKPDKVE